MSNSGFKTMVTVSEQVALTKGGGSNASKWLDWTKATICRLMRVAIAAGVSNDCGKGD